MIDKISISIYSNPKDIPQLRELLSKNCRYYQLDPVETNKIILAVDEACTNIIRHSYANDHSKKIDITLTFYKKRIELKIRDYGKKFDINSVQERDLSEIRVGGLGVFFIKSIMDEVKSNLSLEIGSELYLSKNIS